MKALRVSLVVVMVAGLYAVVPRAWACSCAGDRSRAERFDEDWDAIFVGKVLRIRDLDRTDGGQGQIDALFRVDRVNKGSAYVREHVHTAENGGLCGVPFRPGQRWQVWASRARRGWLSTALCAPNSNLSRGGTAYEPRSYAPLAVGEDLPTTGVPMADPAAGIALMVLAGFAARRRPPASVR